jgi:hypothetical protein
MKRAGSPAKRTSSLTIGPVRARLLVGSDRIPEGADDGRGPVAGKTTVAEHPIADPKQEGDLEYPAMVVAPLLIAETVSHTNAFTLAGHGRPSDQADHLHTESATGRARARRSAPRSRWRLVVLLGIAGR